MAKKITKEEFKEKNKISNKFDILKLISIILNSILIVVILIIVILYVNDKNKIKELELDKQLITENYENDISEIDNGKSLEEIKEKLDFYDENIVFVIIGEDSHYYTYDCVQKKYGDKEYSFLAFNKSAAKGNGYKKGKC